MRLDCTKRLSLTVHRTRSSYSNGLGVASLLPPSTVNLTVARHRCAVAARADPMGMDPPVGGTFHFENLVMPPLTKTCPKMVLPIKGVAFCVKDVFAKKFLVPGEIPVSALAPARRAAAESEPKAPPCPLTVRAHHGARPCWRKSTC